MFRWPKIDAPIVTLTYFQNMKRFIRVRIKINYRQKLFQLVVDVLQDILEVHSWDGGEHTNIDRYAEGR